MQKTNKDELTLCLFDPEKRTTDETHISQTTTSNVISFSDALSLKKEQSKQSEEENLRSSIMRAYLNHAKNLNW